MDANWVPICSWATVVYLAFIFGVQSYMKDRYEICMSLAVFSIIGACRVWPEFITNLSTKGVYSTVCEARSVMGWSDQDGTHHHNYFQLSLRGPCHCSLGLALCLVKGIGSR